MEPITKIDAQADYGIDAPTVVRRFFVFGVLGLVIGGASIVLLAMGRLQVLRFFVFPAMTMGGIFLLEGAVMLWGSLVGKMRLRDKIIRSIPWRGDENVLDVGCGHGLMLIGAAKQLRAGKAVGIDLWKNEDQAGNSREATWRNVEIENVAGKVVLKDGDARKLEFADNTFDVVLSSWAIHNIYNIAEREMAVREIIRVLKPGGRVVIVDIRHIEEYAEVFREKGLIEIKRSRPNFLFVIPTFTLTARKA